MPECVLARIAGLAAKKGRPPDRIRSELAAGADPDAITADLDDRRASRRRPEPPTSSSQPRGLVSSWSAHASSQPTTIERLGAHCAA